MDIIECAVCVGLGFYGVLRAQWAGYLAVTYREESLYPKELFNELNLLSGDRHRTLLLFWDSTFVL